MLLCLKYIVLIILMECAGLLNSANEWVSNEEDVSVIIQDFYKNLFTSSLRAEEKIDELLIAVHLLITRGMRRSLERGFTMDKIKSAMFSISADKSPGPDGMNEMF